MLLRGLLHGSGKVAGEDAGEDADVGAGAEEGSLGSAQPARQRDDTVTTPSLESLEKLVGFVEDYFAMPEPVRVTLSTLASESGGASVVDVLGMLTGFTEKWSGALADGESEEGRLLMAAILKPGEARRLVAELGPELVDMRSVLSKVAEQVGRRAEKATDQARRALDLPDS